MHSGKTLLFALAVLLLCSLFATMMATHHVAEGFAPGDPVAPTGVTKVATGSAMTPERLATLTTTVQQANAQANVQALPLGMRPALSPDILAANNITDPVGSPLNPSNDQMRVVTEFYAQNPKKPPTPLSLRDQLMFNVSNLPLDQLTAFKNLGMVAANNANMANMANNSLMMMSPPTPMPQTGGPMQMPVEVAPDAPTTSWSRNGVQIVTNVPQKCTPFVQQTMEADGNYFGARVPPGMPQNAMSFPPASYSYTGPPPTTYIPGSSAYTGPPTTTSFVPGSATFTPTSIPATAPIQPAATKPPPLTISPRSLSPSSASVLR